MSFFTSLSILILVSLIQASLQLPSSVFMIFYHYASGKFSRKKADNLALYYMLGVETFSTIMFLAIYMIYYSVFYHFPDLELKVFPWVMAAVTLALGLISFFFYYKKSKGTELSIPRKTASNIIYRAKSAKTRSDAFMLGCFVSIAELVYILPLFILAVVSINQINSFPRSPLAFLFIISSVIPILTMLAMFYTNHNLAEIEKNRIKNKSFFRFIIALGYMLLAIALASIGVFK